MLIYKGLYRKIPDWQATAQQEACQGVTMKVYDLLIDLHFIRCRLDHLEDMDKFCFLGVCFFFSFYQKHHLVPNADVS